MSVRTVGAGGEDITAVSVPGSSRTRRWGRAGVPMKAMTAASTVPVCRVFRHPLRPPARFAFTGSHLLLVSDQLPAGQHHWPDGWSACMILAGENSSSGGRPHGFHCGDNCVLDGDNFYVEITD
jgi:hypothetical protein